MSQLAFTAARIGLDRYLGGIVDYGSKHNCSSELADKRCQRRIELQPSPDEER